MTESVSNFSKSNFAILVVDQTKGIIGMLELIADTWPLSRALDRKKYPSASLEIGLSGGVEGERTSRDKGEIPFNTVLISL